LKEAFTYGLNPKMLFLVYAIMLYKTTIDTSGAACILLSDMQIIGLPALAVLISLPFLMGFATGIGMAFAGIAFPLLLPLISANLEFNNYALLLAYTSGELGVLLSPVHLCLIFSTEYFKANLAKVYRYIIPPLLAMGAIAVFVYCIA